MRKNDRTIEPSAGTRSVSEGSPSGAWWVVAPLCLMVGVVPLVCLPGIFEYALLPRLFALHLCVALACLGWLLQTRWGRDLRPVSTPLTWPALCWAAVVLLSAPATTHPLDTLVEALNQMALLALFFVAAHTLTLRTLRPVLWASAGAGLAVSLIGILQYHGLAFLDIPSAALPSATFGNRNFAAMYLVCAAPLAGFLFLTARRRSARVLAGLSATLMSVYLVYTRTRSAWVGVVGALLCVGGWLAFRPDARRQALEAVRREMDRHRRNLTVGFLALFVALSALPAHRTIAATSRAGLPYLTESRADVVATATSLFQRDPGKRRRGSPRGAPP
ncbi:MAG: hypothetical protein EXS64_12165 [Candidatus Latescibacteria bacterium]|nr:hypothetical protein [Candidatus Latescibacterota bacterium]